MNESFAAGRAEDPGTYMAENLRQWETWTPLKAASAHYALDGFRRGGVRLRQLEIDEVGDVAGRSLLHLQSHVGVHTLSWARLGARVTGADFSAEGTATARSLARDVAPDARFVCANVYDLPDRLDETFDLVYTSHGVLGWLPDLEKWAQVVARFTAPGGRFYLFEAHPTAWLFDQRTDSRELRVRYGYFSSGEPLRWRYRSPLSVPGTETDGWEFSWGHGMGTLVNALLGAGLTIEFLHEWPFVGWPMFPFLEEREDGWWHLPDGVPSVPLSLSLMARKPLPPGAQAAVNGGPLTQS
ncbi:class I SAM-dependent methyltransferase [Streptomyces sp. NPDC008001]|uniref:class I SAM-dependent methyltransferase n=1 Tax=Streptomyces sp. NPDC008001 TaxID=3364804 RepID=UPI0036E603A9